MSPEQDETVSLIRSLVAENWPAEPELLTSSVFNRLTSDIASNRNLSALSGSGGYDFAIPSYERATAVILFVKTALEIIEFFRELLRRDPTVAEVKFVLAAGGGQADKIIETAIKRSSVMSAAK
jgi:hypothetical protein